MDEESISITIDDIIDDIKASLVEEDVVGLTAEQISLKLGFGLKKTAKLLRKQIQAGKLKAKPMAIIDVAGRKNYTIVYYPANE